MKRVIFAVITFIVILACTAPLVLAEDDPGPPPGSTGGCTGPGCK